MSTSHSKTFLITGVSSGLGRAFAQAALEAGHRVIGTVRRAEDAEAFAALHPGKAHPLVLDVTDFAAIPGAVAGRAAARRHRCAGEQCRLRP
jgi:NAD(P)-dependent dehydrogenase (short-subunit alcohol dehydrogenase family)